MAKNTDKVTMRFSNNSRGFSIVEVMVAAVLLAITVGSVMMLVGGGSDKNVFRGAIGGTSTCLIEANRLLNGIKEKGQVRNYVTMNRGIFATPNFTNGATNVPMIGSAIGTTVNPAISDQSAEEIFTGTAATDYNLRWNTTAPVYNFAADAVNQTNSVIRPHMLLMGYITSLQSLYMANKSGFCTAANGLQIFEGDTGAPAVTNPYPALFPSPTNLDVNKAKAYIRIEPFNTNNGNIVAGCPDIEIRPPNSNESTITSNLSNPPGLSGQHPAAGNAIAAVPATARSDRGFLVTAKIRFEDRAGSTRECSAQEKFQYGVHPFISSTLEIEDFSTTNMRELGGNHNTTNVAAEPAYHTAGNPQSYTGGNRPIFRGCSETPTDDLRIRINNVAPGSIVMCRDLSQQRPATSNPMIIDHNEAGSPAPPNEIKYGIRQGFLSTAIRALPYYSAMTNNDFVAGLYYPAGTYYCNTGCSGLPRFPTGAFTGGGTLGTDYARHQEGGNEYPALYGPRPVRYYAPMSGKNTVKQDTTLRWKPCERVSICGVNPLSAHHAPDATGQSGAYHMRYNGMPNGCEVHLQVAVVDSAYNTRTTTVQTYFGERVPGNFVCFRSSGLGTNNAWYFSCSATAPVATSCSFPGGASGVYPSQTHCCMPFPIFRHLYRKIGPNGPTTGL